MTTTKTKLDNKHMNYSYETLRPLVLEERLLALHADPLKNATDEHVYVISPNGRIYTTRGGEVFGNRPKFTKYLPIPGLRFSFARVVLAPGTNADAVRMLYRDMCQAMCIEILRRAGALPCDDGDVDVHVSPECPNVSANEVTLMQFFWNGVLVSKDIQERQRDTQKYYLNGQYRVSATRVVHEKKRKSTE